MSLPADGLGVPRYPAARRPRKSTTDSDRPSVRRGAKALFVEDGAALVVTERRPDGSTFQSLPGGGVEPGESLRECLTREITEELRCRVSVGGLVGRCRYEHTTKPRTETVYHVFAGNILGKPTPNRSEGVVSVHWHTGTEPPSQLLSPFEQFLVDTDRHPTSDPRPVDDR